MDNDLYGLIKWCLWILLSGLSRKGSGFSGIASVEVRYKFLGVFKLCGW